jgi:hypothetical protein
MHHIRLTLDSLNISVLDLLNSGSEDEYEDEEMHYIELSDCLREALERLRDAIWQLWLVLKARSFNGDCIYAVDDMVLKILYSTLRRMTRSVKVVKPNSTLQIRNGGASIVETISQGTSSVHRLQARLKLTRGPARQGEIVEGMEKMKTELEGQMRELDIRGMRPRGTWKSE